MHDRGRALPSPRTVAAAGLCLLLLASLWMPIDHDEGQYIAATRLVAEGWRPILDFPYLQTPLQPWLLAPLQWIAPGWLLIASRLANALFVAGAAWLTGRTAERLSGRASVGGLAALLLLLCDSVQFAGTVARNDALPLFLLALGLERLWVEAPSRPRLFVAGLALAAAASTKISYALPAAAVAAVEAWRAFRHQRVGAVSLFAGLIVGALPTFLTLALSPTKAWFDMVTYSVDGVRAFQTLNGSLDQLGVVQRSLRFLKFAALGPVLVLLGIAAWRARVAGARSSQVDAGAGLVLLAALVAAILPMPAYRQYLVPLVVPLLLYLAARGGLVVLLGLRRTHFTFLIVLFALAGTARTITDLVKARPGERPIHSTADAHRIGDLARKAGMTTIASLDSVRATDTGLAIDPRLAPGPFLFRAGNLVACRDRSLCPVTFANIAQSPLSPRSAVLTGSETKPIGPLARGLDGPVEAWAEAQGLAPIRVGAMNLWLPVSPQAPEEDGIPRVATLGRSVRPD